MGKFPAQASTRLPPLLTLFSAPESGCRIHPSRPARREKGRKPDRSLTALLPLREKVSAKPTDEGPRRRLPSGGNDLAETLHRPLIRAAFAAHLLPQGEKGTRSASLHRPSWPGAVGEAPGGLTELLDQGIDDDADRLDRLARSDALAGGPDVPPALRGVGRRAIVPRRRRGGTAQVIAGGGERRFQPRRRRSGHRRADHQVIEPTVDDHRLV